MPNKAESSQKLLDTVNRGNKEAVKNLLKLGPNEIDVNAKDNDGETALHCAVKWHYIEIIRALLKDERIDVNAKDNGDQTALHYAMVFARNENRVEIVTLLLDKKADINAQNIYGKTALDFASRNGHEDVIEMLQERMSQQASSASELPPSPPTTEERLGASETPPPPPPSEARLGASETPPPPPTTEARSGESETQPSSRPSGAILLNNNKGLGNSGEGPSSKGSGPKR